MSILTERSSIDSHNNKIHQNSMRLSRLVSISEFDCSLISYGKMRFLITAAPRPSTMVVFKNSLVRHNVTHLVRVCDSEYDATTLNDGNIKTLDYPFEDGKMPSDDIVKCWLDLVSSVFKDAPEACIAVHCKAGLGRAPVLVAIALMECGMSFSDAIVLIRRHRKAAFNTYQVEMLSLYRGNKYLRHLANERCTLL